MKIVKEVKMWWLVAMIIFCSDLLDLILSAFLVFQFDISLERMTFLTLKRFPTKALKLASRKDNLEWGEAAGSQQKTGNTETFFTL